MDETGYGAKQAPILDVEGEGFLGAGQEGSKVEIAGGGDELAWCRGLAVSLELDCDAWGVRVVAFDQQRVLKGANLGGLEGHGKDELFVGVEALVGGDPWFDGEGVVCVRAQRDAFEQALSIAFVLDGDLLGVVFGESELCRLYVDFALESGFFGACALLTFFIEGTGLGFPQAVGLTDLAGLVVFAFFFAGGKAALWRYTAPEATGLVGLARRLFPGPVLLAGAQGAVVAAGGLADREATLFGRRLGLAGPVFALFIGVATGGAPAVATGKADGREGTTAALGAGKADLGGAAHAQPGGQGTKAEKEAEGSKRWQAA